MFEPPHPAGETRPQVVPDLDDYRPVAPLGRSGAETWLAAVRTSGASVVVKSNDPGDPNAVRRAFTVLRNAECQHLPAPVELARDRHGGEWLVVDWVEGSPFAAGPTDLGQVFCEILGLARALRVVHQLGWHHGDLSPANVVLSADGAPVLLDFGFCGRTGVGTPGFLAPEALRGTQGPAADIFALGCLTLYRAFGRTPFSEVQELLAFHGANPQWWAHFTRDGAPIPGAWRDLLAAMLAPEPARRPNAEQLLAALSQLPTSWQATVDAHSRTPVRWNIPRHLRFRGDAIRHIQEALAQPVVTIVALAAPAGSGRRRVLGELRQEAHATVLLPGIDRPRTWSLATENWLEHGEAGVCFVHAADLQDDPDWARILAAATPLAAAKLVVAVTPAQAVELHAALGAGLARVELPRWEEGQIGQLLSEWLEFPASTGETAGERLAWLRAIVQASESWPARVVRIVRACAHNKVSRRDETWLRQVAEFGAGMTRDQALSICAAAFGHRADGITAADDPEPITPETLVRARHVLGEHTYQTLAESIAAVAPQARAVPLLVALDARAQLHTEVLELDHSGDEWPATLSTWLANQSSLPDPVAAAFLRHQLRHGEARRAWEWSQAHVEPGAEAWCEALRAAQQVGLAAQVLAHLDGAGAAPAWQTFALALRWRSLIDLGRASEVVDAATHPLHAAQLHDPTGDSLVRAMALLWAGYAASVADSEPARSEGFLCAALSAIAQRTDWRAHGVRGRILQLLGNACVQAKTSGRALEYYHQAAASFLAAGEHVGWALSQSNVCALALLTGALELACDAGQRALRALLSRRQFQPLVSLVHNLVQALLICDARTLADAVVSAVEMTITGQGVAPLDRLRIEAMRLRCGLATGQGSSADPRAAFSLVQGLAAAHAQGEALALAADLALWTHQDRPSALHDLALAFLTDDDTGSLGVREVDAQLALGVLAAARPLPIVLAEIDTWSPIAAARRLVWGWHLASTERPSWARAAAEHISFLATQSAPAQRSGVIRGLMRELGNVSQLSTALLHDLAQLGSEGATNSLALAEVPAAASPQDLVQTENPLPRRRESAPLERVVRWYRRIATEVDPQTMADRIVDALLELTQAERAMVGFRALGRELSAKREVQSGSSRFAVSKSVIERVTSSGLALLSVDAAADGRLDQAASVSHLHLRSVLAVPLIVGGSVVGVAYVDDRLRRGAFDSDALTTVEYFAELAALALTHAIALDDLRQRSCELEMSQAQLAARLEASTREVAGMREQGLHRSVQQGRYREMIGHSAQMVAVFRLIERLAQSTVAVFISGESGTGKELVARALHDAGPRASGPFVAENCGAIPETLLESVLFGHAKGAFTGAEVARAGLFELAEGGTIFLDELGEMSLPMQAKLLRVLQESEVRRIGESKPRKLNARVIAASNCNLEEMVRKGTFRRDLYYRIHVVQIDLPPLRERLLDLPQLTAHLLARHGGSHLRVRPSALRRLSTYAWPGNVRELENEVLRWVALSDGEVNEADLSPSLRGEVTPEAGEATLLLRPQVERLERALIARALDTCKGNQSQAAALLGLSRFGLQKKLKRLGESAGGDGDDN